MRFTRLVPYRRIEQAVAFVSGDPALTGEMLATWTFEPVTGGTLVTVSCRDVPRGIDLADHTVALASTLDILAVYAEGQAA